MIVKIIKIMGENVGFPQEEAFENYLLKSSPKPHTILPNQRKLNPSHSSLQKHEVRQKREK